MHLTKKNPTHGEDDGEDVLEAMMLGGGILSPYAPVITLRGEVTDSMAGKFRTAVDKLRYQRNSPVCLLEINSVGGSLLAALEMLNTMRSTDIEFVTYNASHAYSAGALLLSAGSPGARFMSPLSSAMIHSMSTHIAGGIEEISIETKHFDRLNDMMLDEIARNCKTSVAKLKKVLKDNGSRDLWLTPEEALNIKLIDKIAVVSLDPVQGFNLNVVEPNAGGKSKK